MQNTEISSRQALFRYLLANGGATRQDIFGGLGMSLPTIKVAIESLESENYIHPLGRITNTGGRNAITYGVDPEGRYAAGLYLSQHRIEAVCVDQNGDIVASETTEAELDAHDLKYLKKIGTAVKSVIEKSSIDASHVIGAGIAVPSLVDVDGEHIVYGMTSDFSGVTRKWLSRYIDLPTLLIHDSDAAGFAEIWRAPEDINAVYLNINDSIGGSVFIGGRQYHGNNSLAGEIGHMKVQRENAKRCYCGKYGCLDTVCRCGALSEITENDLELFFNELAKGNELISSAWDEYLGHLAYAIHNIRMLTDSSIIIGGRIAAFMDSHIGELCDRVDELSVFADPAIEYISVSGLGRRTTAAGAAISVLDEHISNL